MIRKTSAAVCDDQGGWYKTPIGCVSSGGVRRSVAQYVHDAWWNRYRKQSARSILFPIFVVSYNVTYTTYKTTIFTKQSGSNHETLPSLSCPLLLLKTPYDVFKCVLRHSSFLVIFPCHSCSWSQAELNKQDQLPYSITENIALK